jgi:hypothetical protein
VSAWFHDVFAACGFALDFAACGFALAVPPSAKPQAAKRNRLDR